MPRRQWRAVPDYLCGLRRLVREGLLVPDVGEVGDHHRAARVEVVQGALSRLGVAGESPQEPAEAVVAGDAGVRAAVRVAHDHLALGVGKGALALAVGVAGERAAALAAQDHVVSEGAYRRVRPERGRPLSDRLDADVVVPRVLEQQDVAARHAGRSERLRPTLRLGLVQVAVAERGHLVLLSTDIVVRYRITTPLRDILFSPMAPEPTDQDYRRLLALRTGLRPFLHWSERQARAAGLTPAQHQLLLAIKGHRGGQDPTIGDLAGYLLLHHHSAVELVDRAAAAGLVERRGDAEDDRVTRVGLTADGEARLSKLAAAHLDELRNLAPVLDQLVAGWAAHDPDAP